MKKHKEAGVTPEGMSIWELGVKDIGSKKFTPPGAPPPLHARDDCNKCGVTYLSVQ